MQEMEKSPGVLDDVSQEVIANLERGREQLTRLVKATHETAATVLHEESLLRQESQAYANEIPGLEERVRVAAGRLDDLSAQPTPDISALVAASEELAEARLELRLGYERQKRLIRMATRLGAHAQHLGEMAQHGDEVVTGWGDGIASVVAAARELGSRLESAQQSRALGLHVIRAQEEERRHLAREIHDGPAQLLNSVVLRIDVCQRLFDADPQRLRDELQQLKDLVRLSLQDVRKIIFDLRPMALDDLGLIPALRAFLKDFQGKTGIETDFAIFGNDRRYDSAFEVALFRLVQEALTNVYKHAGATRVWVKAETTGGKEIKLTIKDDGVGFDPDKVRQTAAGTKFGLVGMRERAELLGGHMEIRSGSGQGCRLDFVFPLTD